MQEGIDEAGLSQTAGTHHHNIEVDWPGKFLLLHLLQQVEVRIL